MKDKDLGITLSVHPEYADLAAAGQRNIERRAREMSELFTVWSFFPDGTHEADGPPIPGEAAIRRAKSIIDSVGGRLGFVIEIRVVDRGDETVFHWTKADGILFPTPEDCERAKQ